MEFCCNNCLYLNDKKCICSNSELSGLTIPKPDEEICNCHVPWWQEGYGDYGGKSVSG